MAKSFLLFFLVLTILITVHSASANVVINGNATFNTGTASIEILGTTTPITLDSITSSSTGLQTRSTSSDSYHTYKFSSATNPNPLIQLTSLSSTEADFTIISALNDLIGFTVGDALNKVLVDGANVDSPYNSIQNQFTVNQGKKVAEFYSTGFPASSGGGAASSQPTYPVPPITNQQPIGQITTISLQIPKQPYQIAKTINVGLKISWNTPQQMTINNIQFGDSPFRITFPTPPLTFNGSPTGNSYAIIYYVIIPPSLYCSDTVNSGCIDKKSSTYNIPVTVDATIGDKEIIQSNTLALYLDSLSTFSTYLLIPLAIFGIIGAGVFLKAKLLKTKRRVKSNTKTLSQTLKRKKR